MNNEYLKNPKDKKLVFSQSVLKYCLCFVLIAGLVINAINNNLIWDWLTNSDTLTLPTLVNEVSSNFHQFNGWQFPRSIDIFPDGLFYFLLHLIRLGNILSVVLAIVPTLMIFIYLTVKVVSKSGQIVRYPDLLFSIGVVFGFFELLRISPTMCNWVAKYFFSAGNHFTSAVFAILSLYLTIENITKFLKFRIILTCIIIYLSSLSDLAFVSYLSPALLIVLLAGLFWRKEQRSYFARVRMVTGLNFTAMIAGIASQRFFNRQPNANVTLRPSTFVHRILNESREVYLLLRHSPSAVLFAMVLVAIVGVKIWVLFGKKGFKGFNYFNNSINLFTISTIFAIIVNPILSAFAWENIDSSRYLMMTLIGPVIFLPNLLLSLRKVAFFKTSIANMIVVVLACLSFYGFATYNNRYSRSVKPVMSIADCVNTNHGEVGLAGYWTARHLTYLSENRMKLIQMTPWPTTPDGLMFIWGNNSHDYIDKYQPFTKVNYIVTNSLNEDTLLATFGKPRSKTTCGSEKIWFYNSDTSLLAAINRGHINLYEKNIQSFGKGVIPAANFKTQLGVYLGDDIVITANTKGTGFGLYGGYIELQPGHYYFELAGKTNTSQSWNSVLGSFQIATNYGTRVLSQKEISKFKPRFSVKLDLYLKQAQILEPRVVLTSRDGSVTLNSLTIVKERV